MNEKCDCQLCSDLEIYSIVDTCIDKMNYVQLKAFSLVFFTNILSFNATIVNCIDSLHVIDNCTESINLLHSILNDELKKSEIIEEIENFSNL